MLVVVSYELMHDVWAAHRQRQAIIWTNAGISLIGTLGTNLSDFFFIEIHTFSFKKMHLKMSSGKWRPFFLGLNVLSMYLSLIPPSPYQIL